jgi:hypothetical protein
MQVACHKLENDIDLLEVLDRAGVEDIPKRYNVVVSEGLKNFDFSQNSFSFQDADERLARKKSSKFVFIAQKKFFEEYIECVRKK